MYTAAQGLKSLINSRFSKASATLRSMYPEVGFHLFQPSGASLRMLSGSPMKFWYREEVEEIAYQQTMFVLRSQVGTRLGRDFTRHGVRFVDPDIASDTTFDSIPVVRSRYFAGVSFGSRSGTATSSAAGSRFRRPSSPAEGPRTGLIERPYSDVDPKRSLKALSPDKP